MSGSPPGIIHAGIIGAGGFTGQELIKLISTHPNVNISWVTSDRYASLKLSQIFKNTGKNYSHLIFSKNPIHLKDIPELDVIFIAAPDEVSLQWTGQLLKKNIKVIDIGGSFRLKNISEFEKYYRIKHNAPKLVQEAIYGLTEVNRKQISSAHLVANPGCYPTACLLPLYFLKRYLIKPINFIIIDAKSGVSGAGARKEKENLTFSQISENFYAYKVKEHQHTPEIRESLQTWFNKTINIQFTPHLLPVFRGILSTIYIKLTGKLDIDLMTQELQKKISFEAFIRFYTNIDGINIKNVQNTNFLDFSFYYDKDSQILIVISALDNLIKGAAGQAIQNMNLMFGFKESSSLL